MIAIERASYTIMTLAILILNTKFFCHEKHYLRNYCLEEKNSVTLILNSYSGSLSLKNKQRKQL